MTKNSACSIGIDLGGTKIAAAIVSSAGEVLHEKVIPTHAEEGAQTIVTHIAELVKELREMPGNFSCQAVGIAVAGQVDAKSGTVVFAPNLKWHNFGLQEELKKVINIPIVIVNDVRAATYGEWVFGAGQSLQDLICVFVGTGIGGGVVTGGRLMEGSSNSAGEIGHMVVDLQGRICSCGNRGCLEALASGWAIGAIARDLVIQNPKEGNALLKSVGGHIEALTAKEVFHLAGEGDLLSLQIIDGAMVALIAGTVSLVNAFNPARIIFGGGVINAMPKLIERISGEVKKRALNVATQRLEIVQAGLKVNAGVIGAAKLGLDEIKTKT